MWNEIIQWVFIILIVIWNEAGVRQQNKNNRVLAKKLKEHRSSIDELDKELNKQIVELKRKLKV